MVDNIRARECAHSPSNQKGNVALARHLIRTVEESLGGLDILVCNAGVRWQV